MYNLLCASNILSITITPYTAFLVFCCWGFLDTKMAQRSILLDRQNRMSTPQKRPNGEWWITSGPATPHHRTTSYSTPQVHQLLHTTGPGWLRTDTLKLCAVTSHSATTTKLLSDIHNLTQCLAVTTLYKTVTCHRKPILQQQKHFLKKL